MLSPAQIEDIKARADLAQVAQDLGAVLRRAGGRMVGSCPACGGGKRAARFEVKADGQAWVCAVCANGGDAIRLIQHVTGCDFRAAVDRLGGARLLSEAEIQKIARDRADRERKRAAEQEHFRQKAVEAARRIWENGFAPARVQQYLRARGCDLPVTADIREALDLSYRIETDQVDERGHKVWMTVYSGPAMLARAVDNAGHFSALHRTFLRHDWLAKAAIEDDGEALPAKLGLGSKQGAHIVLRDGGLAPTRLFMGEGIETVLSVATAMHRCKALRPGDAFWSSLDLGNLGGPHKGLVPHPTLKTPTGRALNIPGPVPDFDDARAIAIPPSVVELTLLGDGDSDPFLTRTTLERGAARYARPGLTIRIAMAETGKDFNDMLRGCADA